MVHIEGTSVKIEIDTRVLSRGAASLDRPYLTELIALFRRKPGDLHGDFYNTKIYVCDEVEKEYYHLTLDELYGLLKDAGKLVRPSYNLGEPDNHIFPQLCIEEYV